MDQVHLAQIGLGRVRGHTGSVLDRFPGVGITLDSKPFEQLNLVNAAFAEAVLIVAIYR